MVVSVMFTGEFAPLFEILLAIEIMSPKIALDVDLGPAPVSYTHLTLPTLRRV